MKTDYMVIGRVRNPDNINRLAKGIQNKGYSCYNFLEKESAPVLAHMTFQEQLEHFEKMDDFWSDPSHRYYYEHDMQGLKNADTIVMLLPAGLAAHMEAGVSYGLGKKLILIGGVEKPETLYLMFEERYPDIESFLASLETKSS
jgi:hypothetical protein